MVKKHFSIRCGDILIFLFLIFVSVFTIRKTFTEKTETVTVYTPNSTYKFNLKDSGIYEVEGLLGITKIEIKDNKVRIIDSPCPQKTCISLGFGSTLICLPNKVFVTVDNQEGEMDAISE